MNNRTWANGSGSVAFNYLECSIAPEAASMLIFTSLANWQLKKSQLKTNNSGTGSLVSEQRSF